LAVLAARADSRDPAMTAWQIALDVAVGVAFITAGAVAPGQPVARAVFAAVGATWLVGSIEHDAALVHHAVLVVVLVGFPTAIPRGRIAWMLVALAVPVAMSLATQVGVAALFTAVAANALASSRRDRLAAWYPAAAALGIAVVLAASWLAARWTVDAFDPSTRLTTYELLLLAISLAFPVAMRTVIAGRARLADDVLEDTGLAGLSGLAAVLRDVLRDPDLRLCRWEGPELGYVDVGDGGRGNPTDGRWLFVEDASGPLAAVAHRSAALDDPPTAAAVSTAVRLAVVHEQLQQALAARLDDLSAARTRLMAAADRQRIATATRLRGDVVGPLEHAVAELESITVTPADGEAAQAVGVAVQELTAGAADVLAVVGGVPPAVLGGNRLCSAVESLVHRSPVDVRVQASPAAAADSETETTLFYVCSEAVTNAVKHARASRIDVAIDGDERSVTVTICDDGCGGADATGSGLQGLADRLAARHGRLRVKSPPGAGTSVTATIPRQN
jgi:signal transduction histidine kinase